ncbi:MAG: hypothetical protein AB1511_13140, partial [Deinococcota bacterium]
MMNITVNEYIPPAPMGGAEWTELAVFWLLAFTLLALLVLLIRPSAAQPSRAVHAPARATLKHWRCLPEVRLLTLGLPLELAWEIVQYPLYDVWHHSDWSYILYGLAHCTLGDLLILLVIHTLVAAFRRDRAWHRHRPVTSGLAFTLLGVGYTVFSEIYNVRIKETWGYTELMPIVPWV